jgi:hypothetical protein
MNSAVQAHVYLLTRTESLQATNGCISNIRTHLKGLQRMVIVRGGLQEPSINPYALRLVLWYDHLYNSIRPC